MIHNRFEINNKKVELYDQILEEFDCRLKFVTGKVERVTYLFCVKKLKTSPVRILQKSATELFMTSSAIFKISTLF